MAFSPRKRHCLLLLLVLLLIVPGNLYAQEGGALQDLLRRAFGTKQEKMTSGTKTRTTAPVVNVIEKEAEGEEPEELPKFIVFLDAGHGGGDGGVKSPDYFLEKEVTLKLAKAIAARLSKHEGVEVVFSRQDDKKISLVERINKANGSGASLILSLHTGGSVRPQSRPAMIYLHKGEEGHGWKNANASFALQNSQLASRLQKAIETKVGRTVSLIETDRLFLGAFNAPALMIEPVNLADPADQMKLQQDDTYLEALGGHIARALIAYGEDHNLFGNQ